jgi:uncharacterized protein YjdB
MILPIPAPSKIHINESQIDLYIGDNSHLSVNTNERVFWSSSNRKIVSIDDSGEVEAIREGHAIITAECFGHKYKCDVTVLNK